MILKDHRHENITAFSIALLALLLIYFQLIFSGYYYRDDQSRAAHGFIELAGQGRPLAELLLKVFTFNGKLMDATPLMQLIALGLMGLTAVCIRNYSGGIKSKNAALISIAAFTSPFFLQNMSFKFDSLPMTASVFMAFLAPISFRLNKGAAFLSFYLCSLAALLFYQAAINTVFAVSLSVIAIDLIKGNEKNVRNLFICIIGILAALITYKLSLGLWFSPNGYSQYHSKSLELDNIIPGYFNNIKSLFSFANSNLTNSYRLFFCLSLALSVASIFFNSYQGKENRRLAIKITALVILVLAVMSTVGVLGLLQHPVYEPRVFLGFMGIIFFIGYFSFSIVKNKYFKGALTGLLMVCIMSSAVSSSIYGNTLSYLKTYNSFKIGNIIEQVNQIAYGNNAKAMAVKGTIEFPLIVNRARHNVPIIGTILKPYLDGYWIGGVTSIAYGKSSKIDYLRYDEAFKDEMRERYCKSIPDYASYSYEIRTIDNIVFVDFDNTCKS